MSILLPVYFVLYRNNDLLVTLFIFPGYFYSPLSRPLLLRGAYCTLVQKLYLHGCCMVWLGRRPTGVTPSVTASGDINPSDATACNSYNSH